MHTHGHSIKAHSVRRSTSYKAEPKFNDKEVFVHTAHDLTIGTGLGKNKAIKEAKKLALELGKQSFTIYPKYYFSKELYNLFMQKFKVVK